MANWLSLGITRYHLKVLPDNSDPLFSAAVFETTEDDWLTYNENSRSTWFAKTGWGGGHSACQKTGWDYSTKKECVLSRPGLAKLARQQDKSPPPTKKGFSRLPRKPSIGKVDWTLGGVLSGTKPVVERFSQNFDFAGFAPVMSATYKLLKIADPKIKGEISYCVFQHAWVEILNGYLLDIVGL